MSLELNSLGTKPKPRWGRKIEEERLNRLKYASPCKNWTLISNSDVEGYENVHFSKCNSRLFHLVQFVKCWHIFLELNSRGLYIEVQEKKKKIFVLCSRPPQNVKLGTRVSRRRRVQ